MLSTQRYIETEQNSERGQVKRFEFLSEVSYAILKFRISSIGGMCRPKKCALLQVGVLEPSTSAFVALD